VGELQYGIYDDECEGLIYEEINALHGFSEDGDPTDESDQSSDSEENNNHKEDETDARIEV
jgi:hypothetical protein